jgi:hypothetical protein
MANVLHFGRDQRMDNPDTGGRVNNFEPERV